ncbi:attacin-A [Drosophila grimshawi]|uniref:GH18099 n=1 Tax=Drosophila grimshawi TaxID=7222 RepID=B4JH10_DROGR|nr:attacin-A [Drosophila grimshawi]EDV93788.1 GH18099 [Drosophila grimshawi]
MECQANGDPKTGAASMKCGVVAGDEQFNARAGVFATKDSVAGPVTKGVYGAVNSNGHSLSLQHGHTEHFGSSTTAAAQANLFQNKQAAVNATAFHTHNRTHDQFGGGLNMQTAAGHSAALGVTHVPQFNMTTANVGGRANLYTSPSGNLNVNATANATRHLSGPFNGQKDFGAGLGLQYKF